MGKKIKILLVDDEPDILEFLSYSLLKEGFDVYTADNGESGCIQALENQPDLIVLDIMMPNMDGIQVCKTLRENKLFDDTKIVFLTARGEDYTQINALNQGGDDFIQKPVKINVFMSRIKALLRRKIQLIERNEANLILIGNLAINMERHTVAIDGVEVELVRKEFDLLNYLASKPGRVFNRQEILNNVWGSDVVVGSRTIDVHIRKLREKLGEGIIKTVKGVGYRING